MKGKARDDDRKGAVRKRQRKHVADLEAHVLEPLLDGECARAVDHRGCEIDAGDVARDRAKAHTTSPGPHATSSTVSAARGGGVDQQVQHLLVANRRGGRERHRLLRELIEDAVAM